ncbi:MAG: lipopolysaccharide transport periplasmic protein LptA [Natronospirillum sp.]|uniref:lipopolysaccharide transport periplasmic protein LptA n=1 Tax=Natronospirillum sp. TaxID=2812955 RepID=UPI0025DD7653|nr:lipopolysaccharide transport periplasmic protein LptA [Natronospirillum sp.]MCH8552252.1 lipopolysaccharide transport periplasmic protein LptA [Natronospirillum sp.]
MKQCALVSIQRPKLNSRGRRRPDVWRPLTLAALCLLTAGSLALPGDRELPVDIQADRNRGNLAANEIIYLGDVRIEQGTLIIVGDEVRVYRTENNDIERMEAYGAEPARVSDQLQEDQPYTHLFGLQVIYDAEAGFITATGEARLQQGRNLVTAHYIRYNLETEEFESDRQAPDGSTGARVSMCLIPDNSESDEEMDPDAEAAQRPTSCQTVR